jgi:hypothetical protein
MLNGCFMNRWFVFIGREKSFWARKRLAVFFAFWFVSAYADGLFFKNLSVTDGLSQGIVYCIH